MIKPVRLRLSRKRNFNLQAASEAVNGLPAVFVARPSKWGNPLIVGKYGTAAECNRGFSDRRNSHILQANSHKPFIAKDLMRSTTPEDNGNDDTRRRPSAGA